MNNRDFGFVYFDECHAAPEKYRSNKDLRSVEVMKGCESTKRGGNKNLTEQLWNYCICCRTYKIKLPYQILNNFDFQC